MRYATALVHLTPSTVPATHIKKAPAATSLHGALGLTAHQGDERGVEVARDVRGGAQHAEPSHVVQAAGNRGGEGRRHAGGGATACQLGGDHPLTLARHCRIIL